MQGLSLDNCKSDGNLCPAGPLLPLHMLSGWTSLAPKIGGGFKLLVGETAGALTVTKAVPIVTGSNIGTSVTNTLVSFTQIADKESFRSGLCKDLKII